MKVCTCVSVCAQTMAYCTICCWTNMASALGGRGPETEACGQREVGGMEKWTERKMDRKHDAAATHSIATHTFWLQNTSHCRHKRDWWCLTHTTTYNSSPPHFLLSLRLPPLLFPAWAWDKNAARHQVLLWQQRTAQVRIIWTDAIVNVNNKTGDDKCWRIPDQLPDIFSSGKPHRSQLQRGEAV